MTAWQPIETAPKMKNILMWAATDISDFGEIRNWKIATGYWSTGHDAWIWDGSALKTFDVKPTHWMPLPDPPLDPPKNGAW